MGPARAITCPGALVPIDDTSLWVVSRGPADGNALIVLHGGPGLDHHEFGDYLDPLVEDGVRLLLVDLRAQGRSDAAPPVLVLAGRHDRTCPVAASERMVELLPNSELQVFEESAHMTFVEEPDLFRDAVGRFLSR